MVSIPHSLQQPIQKFKKTVAKKSLLICSILDYLPPIELVELAIIRQPNMNLQPLESARLLQNYVDDKD